MYQDCCDKHKADHWKKQSCPYCMIVELHAEVEKWRNLTELQCQDNREVAKLDEENQLLRKLVKDLAGSAENVDVIRYLNKTPVYYKEKALKKMRGEL